MCFSLQRTEVLSVLSVLDLYLVSSLAWFICLSPYLKHMCWVGSSSFALSLSKREHSVFEQTRMLLGKQRQTDCQTDRQASMHNLTGSILHYWMFFKGPQYARPLRKQNLQSQAQDIPFWRNLKISDILPSNLSGIDSSGLSFKNLLASVWKFSNIQKTTVSPPLIGTNVNTVIFT